MSQLRKVSPFIGFPLGESDEQHGAYGGIRCHGFGIDGRGPDSSQLPGDRRRLVREGTAGPSG